MSETKQMMGAIARGDRFILAVGGDDPEHIVTWGEAVATIAQLMGDLRHECRDHEKTRDLLKLVERSSEATIWRQRSALMALRPILADHHDIEDGGEGDEVKQRPNWAMRATNLIDEALAPFPPPKQNEGDA